MFSKAMIVGLLAGTVLSGAFASDALAADYRVRARIRTGTPLEAKGDYRERTIGNVLSQRFTVEINGAAANTEFEVQINGMTVAFILTDTLGHAEIQFADTVVDDNPDDNDPPLPQDFPHISAGDTLTVGTMTATFR